MRVRGLGYASQPIRATTTVVSTQLDALKRLAALAQKDVVHPLVRETALQITSVCPSKLDGYSAAEVDQFELLSIFDAVKTGRSDVPALRHGLRYVADPRWSDLFTAPSRILQLSLNGANGGDCDDHAALVAALAGAVGFKAGVEGYGANPNGDLNHVYAVVRATKHAPSDPATWAVSGLDTTVPYSTVGWRPPPGRYVTVWLE